MQSGTAISTNVNHFEANVSALAEILPDAAAIICNAPPPNSLEESVGRDGSRTYCWREADGSRCWLGRTSMPTVSGPALVDAFQPGNGNVLLYGMGSGVEVRLLLDKLERYQAILVIEPMSWPASLVLRLHNFDDAFRSGRLLLFPGPDAWQQFVQFLHTHPGYLEPQRVLSWPWFEAATVSEVTQHLTEANNDVATHRAALRAASLSHSTTHSAKATGKTIALLSVAGSEHTWRLAAHLQAAANAIGWSSEAFVLNHPAKVHPIAVEMALLKSPPSMCILIDTPPGACGYQLPPCPVCTWWTHPQTPSAEFLTRMDPGSIVAVSTETIRRAAIQSGMTAERTIVIPPAASATIRDELSPRGRSIAVIADGGDPSSAAAGLNLATHIKLWNAAMELVRDRCDQFTDEDVDEILRTAEARLKIRLESDEVRRGIVDRLRQRMSIVVAQAFLAALHESGIAFDLLGGGWRRPSTTARDKSDEVLASHLQGQWPDPEHLNERLARYRTVICLDCSGRLRSELLDAMAVGLAAFVRRHPHDESKDGIGAVLDVDQHVRRFQSRAELLTMLRGAANDYSELEQMAHTASQHVRAGHTWTHRLQDVLRAGRAV